MKDKKRAVAAGHICIDITPIFPEKQAAELASVLSPGKLIRMEGVDIHTGGSVANTGLAMKLLGADVTLMGKIGNDEFGALILDLLKKYDAEKGMIVSDHGQSSYSVVLAIPGIDRVFLHDPGANDTFSYDDLDFEAIKRADLFHFGYPPLMKKMYENGGAELTRILQTVHEAGTAVSLDMAAVDASSDAGKADWEGILKRILPYVDFFVPSAEELCFMLDRSRYKEWTARANGKDITEVLTVADIAPLGEKAVELGACAALIKCGAPGIYYKTKAASDKKMRKLCERLNLSLDDWADKRGFERSYVPERVLSGTGAGDASIAAFLSSALEGGSLKEALQMATAAGACCVSAYDALSGLKPLSELKEKIRCGWEKI